MNIKWMRIWHIVNAILSLEDNVDNLAEANFASLFPFGANYFHNGCCILAYGTLDRYRDINRYEGAGRAAKALYLTQLEVIIYIMI